MPKSPLEWAVAILIIAAVAALVVWNVPHLISAWNTPAPYR